jgi:hypothetical protein
LLSLSVSQIESESLGCCLLLRCHRAALRERGSETALEGVGRGEKLEKGGDRNRREKRRRANRENRPKSENSLRKLLSVISSSFFFLLASLSPAERPFVMSSSARLPVVPTVTVLAVMKSRLAGAIKGHSLLKKKADALTIR